MNTPDATEPPLEGLPWYQYSLRSLFVFVTVVAVVVFLIHSLRERGILILLASLCLISICYGAWSDRGRYVWLGIGLLLLLGAGLPLGKSIDWVGNKKVLIGVRVRDNSGALISGASVELTGDARSWRYMATTDSNGVAQLFGEFQTCGTDSVLRLRNTGYIQILGEHLTVSAAGYQEFSKDLEEITPQSWDLFAATIPEVVVTLKPDKRNATD